MAEQTVKLNLDKVIGLIAKAVEAARDRDTFSILTGLKGGPDPSYEHRVSEIIGPLEEATAIVQRFALTVVAAENLARLEEGEPPEERRLAGLTLGLSWEEPPSNLGEWDWVRSRPAEYGDELIAAIERMRKALPIGAWYSKPVDPKQNDGGA